MEVFCLYAACMPGAHRGEKEVDLLGLELEIVVSRCSVGVGESNLRSL